jgi:starch-binding outer membrane protein, SusD/RagB family
MKNNLNYIIAMIAIVITAGSCKKQLDVKNPNEVNYSQLTSEADIIGITKGGTYINGFNGPGGNSLGWLGDSYFSLCLGYHSLLGDEVSGEAANQLINQISLPDKVTYDNATTTINSAPSKQVFRINNSIFNPGNNPVYFEWISMYALNNASNKTLSLMNNIKFIGTASDTAAKKNTLRAWAYWWKGFAYSRIGSLYYAGLISNTVDATKAGSNNYISSAAMIVEANKNLDLAASMLTGISNTATYEAMLGELIPAFCQVGNGGVLTKDMWIRNINTLKARNLLVNKSLTGIGGLPTMAAADWNQILTLTNNGILSTDFVFTGRTASSNGFFSAGSGCVQAMTAISSPTAGLKTFRLSERLYQDFKAGDARKANNFIAKDYKNQVGGFTFSTRYALKNKGNGNGSAVIANSDIGGQEIFIAGSYEENELMKAEALINLGGANLNNGLISIDNVRSYQGAGLPALNGSGITQAVAKEELRLERRTALALRGLAFYDARRIGYTYDVSKGGGRSGCVVYTSAGVVNTNAFMNYNFLDYWDVPDDEIYINPPGPGSAPTKNPL